ncbi:MAG: 1-phosphofructokinase [Actinobacteria bacterium]|nr:1-phosphofructokinase [Actinomycetota bacterium]
MIVTVTLNPVLHVRYQAARVALGAVNQISQVSCRAGGQGLAVARVLHAFGHEVLAAGLAGGATGELIHTDLARAGVPTGFTHIGRESRRMVEVTDAAGETTSFSEPSPFITTEEVGRLAADYRALLGGAVAVVLSGSLPAGLPPEIYGTLATYAADAGVPAVIDAGGTELRHGLSRRPALVIPELDGAAPAGNPADLVAGGAGAVVTVVAGEVRASTREGQWRAALTGDPARPGAREALVAGLIPGLVLGWSWPDRLRHSVALAAAVRPAGDVDLDGYERLLPEVPVTGP